MKCHVWIYRLCDVVSVGADRIACVVRFGVWFVLFFFRLLTSLQSLFSFNYSLTYSGRLPFTPSINPDHILSTSLVNISSIQYDNNKKHTFNLITPSMVLPLRPYLSSLMCLIKAPTSTCTLQRKTAMYYLDSNKLVYIHFGPFLMHFSRHRSAKNQSTNDNFNALGQSYGVLIVSHQQRQLFNCRWDSDSIWSTWIVWRVMKNIWLKLA